MAWACREHDCRRFVIDLGSPHFELRGSWLVLYEKTRQLRDSVGVVNYPADFGRFIGGLPMFVQLALRERSR